MGDSQGPPTRGSERGRTHTHWLTMLLTTYCPQCRTVVRKGAAGVVRGEGRLSCCQAHADTCEQHLDTDCRDFQHQHAACHPGSTLSHLNAGLCSMGGTHNKEPGNATSTDHTHRLQSRS